MMKHAICLFMLLCATFSWAEEWTLSGGTGQKLPDGSLEVAGSGSDSNAWLGEPFPLSPGWLRFSMEACSPTGGGGCAPCGLEGFTRDRSDITKAWKPFFYIFRSQNPDRWNKPAKLKVGQWMSSQTYRFRNIRLTPVEPIWRGIASTTDADAFLRLGDGEMIRKDRYSFFGLFSGEGSNGHRTLLRGNCGFNSDRFCFGNGNDVVYRFALQPVRAGEKPFDPENGFDSAGGPKPLRFLSATVGITVNYHTKGECLLEFATKSDPENWITIGKIDRLGILSIPIPEQYFPNEMFFIRIRAGKDSYFQVDQVNLDAAVEPNRGFQGVGETVYADLLPGGEPAPAGYSSRPFFFDEQRTLYVLHRNESGVAVKPIVVNPPNRIKGRDYTFQGPFDSQKVEMPPKSVCVETKPFSKAPEFQVPFSGRILKYSFPFNAYRDARFGYVVPAEPGMQPVAGIWWAEPEWKISPTAPSPLSGVLSRSERAEAMKPIRISAAKNDRESFQLVVAGEKSGRQSVMPTVEEDLRSSEGATLPASNVQFCSVYYHFVHRPTDSTGMLGDWPDALPPVEKPIDVSPNRNQPFWTTVSVPENAKPGVYQGSIRLRWKEGGNDFEQKIPFEVKVWNFALPKRNHTVTAFGISPNNIFRYHGCKTEADKRAVWELYLDLYSKHRISVYNLTPLDPIRVRWNPKSNPPDSTVEFSTFDKEMERIIERYGFTNFRLHIEGMGSGTYEGRSKGQIAGFADGTPEYEAMFSDYIKKLESHLKEKGWLDMAYVYWFDEPEPKDYEFVAQGFAKLRKHAPGLCRMITEEPNKPFLDELEKQGAKIDVWCPVSNNFNDECFERQKQGEKIWWYVCTGPKGPYCTLFIDHPGIELRMWYWQAWQRNIVGSLVWESTYWTSPTAFPESPQNPYEDPMGYVSGGPKGSKRFWGNGDGRFVYPPLEAATPDPNRTAPILKAPVSSIRWEMIREGIEDYEMFLMLRKFKETKKETQPDLAEKIDVLLTIPAGITSSLTDFTKDPQPLRERRDRIAEMLESLQ